MLGRARPRGELARDITNQDRAAWDKGSLEDWVMEGTAWRSPWRTATWATRIPRFPSALGRLLPLTSNRRTR